MNKIFIYFLLVTSFLSCSLIEKIAIKTTSGVITGGSDELLTEGNWEFFNKSVPANLKLMEGLWYSDQGNKQLLTMLIKGYSGYAFASLETSAMTDNMTDVTSSKKIDQVVLAYEKAIFYGFKYFDLFDISYDEFYDKTFSNKLKSVFDDTFSEDDHVAILYMAQAMGSSINFQRRNVRKMGHLSHVKEMLSWVCQKDPELERGSCGLFNSIIQAVTPTLLGGSQKIARRYFKEIIKQQPYNLLARLTFIQYHVIPLIEEDEFNKEMKSLGKDLGVWFGHMKGTRNKKTRIYENHRHFNLFNSIAKERYTTLLKLKNEIF